MIAPCGSPTSVGPCEALGTWGPNRRCYLHWKLERDDLGPGGGTARGAGAAWAEIDALGLRDCERLMRVAS